MPWWMIVRQVLVAGDVQGERLADLGQGLVAAGLRPAVGVEVGQQPVVARPVQVGPAAEDGLREDGLHFGVAPVGGPLAEELQLPLAQQHGPGHVEGLGIVVRIGDVVGPRTHLGHHALGAGLELAVFDDGEADPAPVQAPCSRRRCRAGWASDRRGRAGGWSAPARPP